MKRTCISIFSILFIVGAIDAKPSDSILTAASFPKTANDLTFRQRMDVLADDYEDFDTEFDSNGVCIKNCPYVGMTLRDFEKRIEQTQQEVQQDIIDNQQQDTSDDTSGAPESPNTSEEPGAPEDPGTSEEPEDPDDNSDDPTPPPVSGTTIPTSCPLRVNPVNVSSEMGYRKKYKRNHNGMDLPVSVGTSVYAAADGDVVIRRNEGAKKGYGNYLVIQHAKNYYTVYGHLSKWLVSEGQHVRAGQEIAKSGNTGHSTGPHLHFEVLKNAPLVVRGATPVDPRTITQCPWNPAHR